MHFFTEPGGLHPFLGVGILTDPHSTGKSRAAWRLRKALCHLALASTNNLSQTMNTIFYVVGAVVVIGFILKMLGLY